MKQLFQDPKVGTIQVVDIASPALRPGTILVRHAFSVVSPGTERGTVSAAADAFVLPTVELECFGLIAMEAFASGRPVLAIPVGAIPEIVGGVEPRWLSADAGAPALTRLLSDRLAGRLPVHAPGDLRAFVERGCSPGQRMTELIAIALGETS